MERDQTIETMQESGQTGRQSPHSVQCSRSIRNCSSSSVMQFSGTDDRLGPFFGGVTPPSAGLKGTVEPVKKTIQSWRHFNGCPANAAEMTRVGNAVMERHAPCSNGTEVVLWTLRGGGHTWPGGRVVPNVELLGLGEMGAINRDINASDLMWEFFMVDCHLNPLEHINLWHDDEGKLVGYAILGEDPSFDCQVLPEYEWHGIEVEALAWAQGRLAELRG